LMISDTLSPALTPNLICALAAVAANRPMAKIIIFFILCSFYPTDMVKEMCQVLTSGLIKPANCAEKGV
jgi:hypothetical protein